MFLQIPAEVCHTFHIMDGDNGFINGMKEERRLRLVFGNPEAKGKKSDAHLEVAYQRDGAVVENLKHMLAANLARNVGISSPTKSSLAILKRILSQEFNFDDPQWLDAQVYSDVCKQVDSTISGLRQYGQEYFEDGKVPAKVFTAAIMREHGIPEGEKLKPAKKLLKAALKLDHCFGHNLQDAPPAAQVLFLNGLANDLEADLQCLTTEQDYPEKIRRDILQDYFYFYAPVSKNLNGDTEFENEILNRIGDIAERLDVEFVRKGKLLEFPDSETARKLHTSSDNEKRDYKSADTVVAKSVIVPEEEHAHIWYD